jgi:secreted Zn-dependent insulinase-like peptidase
MGWKNAIFEISVSLTPSGWKDWRGVAKEVYKALEFFKKEQLPKHIVEEINQTRKIDWDWQSRDSGGIVQVCALRLLLIYRIIH